MDAISCLAPPHAALQYPLHPMSGGGGAFTDAAFARALHFSMAGADSLSSGADSSTSSYTLADFAGGTGGGFFAASTPSSSAFLLPPTPPPQPAVTSESVVVADGTSARRRASPAGSTRRQLGPAGAGRAGKRRSRASKRAPTTYICADPANFRLMVQQVTGVEADPDSLLQADGVAVLPTAATTSFDAATSSLHHMMEYTGAFGEKNPFLQAAALQQQQQPCFPTLDSWSVMYESNQLL